MRVKRNGLADLCLVGGKVVEGDIASIGGDLRFEGPADVAAIERIGAFPRNELQGFGQVRRPVELLELQRIAAVREKALAAFPLVEENRPPGLGETDS